MAVRLEKVDESAQSSNIVPANWASTASPPTRLSPLNSVIVVTATAADLRFPEASTGKLELPRLQWFVAAAFAGLPFGGRLGRSRRHTYEPPRAQLAATLDHSTGWAGQDIAIAMLAGGISNALYKVSCAVGSAAFRIYGNNTENFIDRAKELAVMRRVHEYGFGPQVRSIMPLRSFPAHAMPSCKAC